MRRTKPTALPACAPRVRSVHSEVRYAGIRERGTADGEREQRPPFPVPCSLFPVLAPSRQPFRSLSSRTLSTATGTIASAAALTSLAATRLVRRRTLDWLLSFTITGRAAA